MASSLRGLFPIPHFCDRGRHQTYWVFQHIFETQAIILKEGQRKPTREHALGCTGSIQSFLYMLFARKLETTLLFRVLEGNDPIRCKLIPQRMLSRSVGNHGEEHTGESKEQTQG